MTELIATLGGISTFGLVGFVAWLVYRLIKAKDEIINAHDVISSQEKQLASETSAREVAEALLAKEQALRADVEAQRNNAWREAREHAVEIISKSGIADAVSLGNRILHAPLPFPRSVPPLPAAKLSESGDGALEKP